MMMAFEVFKEVDGLPFLTTKIGRIWVYESKNMGATDWKWEFSADYTANAPESLDACGEIGLACSELAEVGIGEITTDCGYKVVRTDKSEELSEYDLNRRHYEEYCY